MASLSGLLKPTDLNCIDHDKVELDTELLERFFLYYFVGLTRFFF